MVLMVKPWSNHVSTMDLQSKPCMNQSVVDMWFYHVLLQSKPCMNQSVVDMWFYHVLFIVNPWFIHYFTMVLTFDGKPMVEIRFYNGLDCKSMVLLWF